MKKYYFITYGTKEFNTSKKHLLHLAKKFEVFDKCYSLSPRDLSQEFKREYNEILNLKRGAGYWIWKHHIISSLLDEINFGDVVVYCDSGSSLNYFAKKRLIEYFDILNSSKYGSLMFECESDFIEKNWTTRQIFDYFNCSNDENLKNSTQLEATQMIFKKNDHSNLIFNEYKNALRFDSYLISDRYNNLNQDDCFIDNRHDQSIFSVISKKFKSEVLKNESNHKSNLTNQHLYPFLAVRTYGHGKKDKIKYALNYKNFKNIPVYFEEIKND